MRPKLDIPKLIEQPKSTKSQAKKHLSPIAIHLTGKVKQTNNTNTVDSIECLGKACIHLINNASAGNPGYKKDINQAIIDGKNGTDELSVLQIAKNKEETTCESEPVKVGKNNALDKVIVSFH